jgi:hypothetical protein
MANIALMPLPLEPASSFGGRTSSLTYTQSFGEDKGTTGSLESKKSKSVNKNTMS